MRILRAASSTEMLIRFKEIKNIGPWISYSDTNDEATFERLTLIYGQNGSGKSTLKDILWSLRNDDKHIIGHNRKSKATSEADLPYIEIVAEGHVCYKYEMQDVSSKLSIIAKDDLRERFQSRWSETLTNIEIFDTNFVEHISKSILSVGTQERSELLCPTDRTTLSMIGLIQQQTKLFFEMKKKKHSRHFIEAVKGDEPRIDILSNHADGTLYKWFGDREDERNGDNTQLSELSDETKAIIAAHVALYKENHRRFLELLRTRLREYGSFLVQYQAAVNRYLGDLDVELSVLNACTHRALRHINVEGSPCGTVGYQLIIKYLTSFHHPISHNGHPLARLSLNLSEGQHRTLALSFFLADLEMKGNYEEQIIVFDDPVTSFDTEKKFITLALIERLLIEMRVKQVILLSHDADLLHELVTRVEPSGVPCARLETKRVNDGNASTLREMNVLRGYDEQLQQLRDYAMNPTAVSRDKRLVLINARMVVETSLKTKFDSVLSWFDPKAIMFGKLIGALKRFCHWNHNQYGRWSCMFRHPDNRRVFIELDYLSNNLSVNLHGSAIQRPGAPSDDDLAQWTPTRLKDIATCAVNLCENWI